MCSVLPSHSLKLYSVVTMVIKPIVPYIHDFKTMIFYNNVLNMINLDVARLPYFHEVVVHKVLMEKI